ncbi:MAG: hypothetical protein GY799_20925 [Desulfobulbaceae bacterium]|nr:hypothetical protein [Desulfobulbaceae bacterium]
MLKERLFCEESNFQLLCKACHKVKSKAELGDRVRWRRKEKFLVCRIEKGSRMEVIPKVNLKELDEIWEVLAVRETQEQAETELKRRQDL